MAKYLKETAHAPRILSLIVAAVATFWAARRFPAWQMEILLAGGFIVFAILLWTFLTFYLKANKYEEKKDFVDVFAKILGGAAVVVSLIFTWQELKLNQSSSETTQRLSLLTLQNTERRQIEDRLNKALEQLGSEKREARIGAIYSLGKIASDSIELNIATKTSDPMFEPPTDFHWTVMQTLASFVRGNAARTSDNPNAAKQIEPDIQAALTVLGWRKRSYTKGEDQRLELYGTSLRGLILKEKDGLPGAGKEGANLAGAQLWNIDLTGAKPERNTFRRRGAGWVEFEKRIPGGGSFFRKYGPDEYRFGGRGFEGRYGSDRGPAFDRKELAESKEPS